MHTQTCRYMVPGPEKLDLRSLDDIGSSADGKFDTKSPLKIEKLWKKHQPLNVHSVHYAESRFLNAGDMGQGLPQVSVLPPPPL